VVRLRYRLPPHGTSGRGVGYASKYRGRKVAFIELEPHEWTEHPGGDDLVAVPMPSHREALRVTMIPESVFLTKEKMKELDIGPGDDVFMVGRFINHEGKQRNEPAARFGNISMMPSEIRSPTTGFLQESFAVEMRSHAGYSGSPVHVYRTPLLTAHDDGGKFPRFRSHPHGTWFLGVNWGFITDDWEITRRKRRARTASADDWGAEVVQANTGMNGVVPACKLSELLHTPKFEELNAATDNGSLADNETKRGGTEFASRSETSRHGG
jgi:hypothetical protein